jgi:hypothetical protein
VEVLDDLSVVEEARRKPRAELDANIAHMRATIEGPFVEDIIRPMLNAHPPLPGDLADAYFEAQTAAQTAALALVAETDPQDTQSFRLLLSVICRLHGQATLGRLIDDLEHADIFERVTKTPFYRQVPERKWRRHVAFLRSKGWTNDAIRAGVNAFVEDAEATGVHEDAQCERALRALAWVARKTPIEAMLHSSP